MARHPNAHATISAKSRSETRFGVRLASPSLMWRLRQPDYGDLIWCGLRELLRPSDGAPQC